MNTKDSIRTYIAKEFLLDNGSEELTDDLDLIRTGIIDSLGILKLVAHIERTNQITIDAEEIEAERFRSVRAIHALLCEKMTVAM